MFNKPVIEYIIWNSKDNPSIIPTNWNIEINLDENDKDILIDIRKIYKEDFDKLNNSNYNNKYNLIKYSLQYLGQSPKYFFLLTKIKIGLKNNFISYWIF